MHSYIHKKPKYRFSISTYLPILRRLLTLILFLISLLLLQPQKASSPAACADLQTYPLLRLHIYAADDSVAAQEQKLQVRDAVLTVVRSLLSDCTTPDEATRRIFGSLDELEKAARACLESLGSGAPVSASYSTEFFPIRRYGSLLLPPGQYRTLVLRIGASKGRNWWCLLYPSLCFTEGITETVTEGGKEALQTVLNADTYETLFSGEEEPIYTLRLAELCRDLKKRFQSNKKPRIRRSHSR